MDFSKLNSVFCKTEIKKNPALMRFFCRVPGIMYVKHLWRFWAYAGGGGAASRVCSCIATM